MNPFVYSRRTDIGLPGEEHAKPASSATYEQLVGTAPILDDSPKPRQRHSSSCELPQAEQAYWAVRLPDVY
ncbi:MAG: hypothetical protein L0287_36700 [Anaerolineae bacterium]|nr:hypothetical protein [Anaerolineae bacterium]